MIMQKDLEKLSNEIKKLIVNFNEKYKVNVDVNTASNNDSVYLHCDIRQHFKSYKVIYDNGLPF